MVPYAVSKIVIALLSPLGTALALGAASVLMRLLARSQGGQRWATVLMVLSLAWLGTWSMPAVSDWLQQQVEAPYPPRRAEAMPKADAIVLLGGGLAPPSKPRLYPDMNEGADRVWHAARLFGANRAPLIVASGGSSPDVTTMSEAEAMRILLVDFGVPSDAVLLEGRSRNTQENAEFTAAAVKGRNVHTILLVTSASHMARAVGEFERVGFRVIPAAADHAQPEVSGLQRWLPATDALDASGRAMKEIVGRAAQELRPGGAGTPTSRVLRDQ